MDIAHMFCTTSNGSLSPCQPFFEPFFRTILFFFDMCSYQQTITPHSAGTGSLRNRITVQIIPVCGDTTNVQLSSMDHLVVSSKNPYYVESPFELMIDWSIHNQYKMYALRSRLHLPINENARYMCYVRGPLFLVLENKG